MVGELLPPPPLADLLERGPLALFVDFDGTLVEIAPSPNAITVPGSLSARLRSLSERLGGRLAVVSGRSIVDLERHCGTLAIALAGSHGADWRAANGGSDARAVPGLPEPVVGEVAAFARREALALESKPHGVALHSRGTPDKEAKALAFMETLASRNGLMTKQGKFVAELVHEGAHKGAAVDVFMRAPPFSGAVPVFIGDDLTDEDGFAACEELGGFGIAVGERHSPGARFRLADPAAVRTWLGL